MKLQGKHIVLGITGSIAAYKACLLIRLLVKEGAEVQVVITPSGKEFITPLTLSTLTRKPVISEFFSQRDGTWNSHVDLGLWADLMVIAPATASTIGKMAHGIADNMLVTTYLSAKCPMDLDMYAHPATQHNIDILRSYGNIIVEPGSGELASQLVGKGRMEEPENILLHICDALNPHANRLRGKKVLITAGPTYEKIDPVRFIGNYSSGKMGYAIAETCASEGAEVTLVSGPTSLQPRHTSIRCIRVESAQEMYEATTAQFADADITILSAAVADFTPEEVAGKKIKREKGAQTLTLQPTHDIAAELGRRKQEGQLLVGFALETHDEEANARHKLEKKNLDLIVLNSLQDAGAGFMHDTNKVTLLTAESAQSFPLKSKEAVATDIIDKICDICL